MLRKKSTLNPANVFALPRAGSLFFMILLFLFSYNSPLKAQQTGPPLMIPDPLISILPPGVSGDPAYWNQQRALRAQNQSQNKSGGTPGGIIYYTEREISKGQNDKLGTAERIRRFGTGPKQVNVVEISGFLGSNLKPRVLKQSEDDGSIPKATRVRLKRPDDAISFFGVIGDGPKAGIVSDYDYYAVYLPANTTYEIRVITPNPVGDLDPFITIFDKTGTIIGTEDTGGAGWDVYTRRLTRGNAGVIYIAVGGSGAFEPANPYQSTGGSSTGVIGSEGSYELNLKVFPTSFVQDVDFYSVYLRKGDVLGAALFKFRGLPYLSVYNPMGELEKETVEFGSFALPESPLPVNGFTVLDYVAEQNGLYKISASIGLDEYRLTLGVYRPGFELEKNKAQVVWLDYNGGPVDKAPWYGGTPTITNHSPLKDFLSAWGLPNTNAQVRRLTRKITLQVKENLQRELRASRENRNFKVVVLGNDGTGRRHPMDARIARGTYKMGGIIHEVSTVEVSGTRAEATLNTIGIASSIDAGNYAPHETALVLLDVLSAPASGLSADETYSLNDVVLAPGVSKEDMIATVLGNIISHEAGHYLGNWHTDGFNSTFNLMDEGPGGLFNLAGIGPSGIFGASDSENLAFIDDDFSVDELVFTGSSNSTVNTAFALSSVRRVKSLDAEDDLETPEDWVLDKLPAEISLKQSIPNSLTPGSLASIEFSMSDDSDAALELFDIMGNKIGTIFKGAVQGGEKKVVVLNAKEFNLKPGIYIYKLITPKGFKHKKIVVREG